MPLQHRHITIEDQGRTVADADLHIDAERAVVVAELHVESGPVPVAARRRLVDAVLQVARLRSRTELDFALPIGDAELLSRLQERVRDVRVRAAGTTCLLRAKTP